MPYSGHCHAGRLEQPFPCYLELIAFSYVQSLLSRLERLKAVQTTIVTPKAPRADDTPSADEVTAHLMEQAPASPPHAETHFDKHFNVSNANPTGWQFFGRSSVFALTVEVLANAQARFGSISRRENYTGCDFWMNAHLGGELPATRSSIDRNVVEQLVALHMSSFNILLPFIDEGCIGDDVEAYISCHGKDVRRLASHLAHQYFRISMMCAISCANKARHHPAYMNEGVQYYAEAVRCVEVVTSDVSADSLVALLLLICFAMFYPRKGDIWKLLDFACRLSAELGYHTERYEAYEDDSDRKRRRKMFWGLYATERIVGQLFGRPSDIPEEIITAEYPANVDTIPLADQKEAQHFIMSHCYRLTYLRSEIFRELYLPAKGPDLPHYWYEQKFANFLTWRRELEVVDHPAGVVISTCDIGLDSSICFLFQPLMLRALARTRDVAFVNEKHETIPSDNFYSACQLIENFRRIMWAPENSPLGVYPVTFISAHVIQMAAMTILSHCLLAIDGRIPATALLSHSELDKRSSIDFGNLREVSGSCLGLLTKSAEIWPGMVGMVDIYENLFSKIMPLMTRSGLA